MEAAEPFEDAIDEDARRRFERAWIDGVPLPIEAVLPQAGDARATATLEELVAIELELAWRAGRGTRVEDYHARFAALRAPAITLRLLREEFRARHRFGDRPSVHEYRARFPDLVPTGSELGEPLTEEEVDRLPELPSYEVREVIGRGGMGVVYGALDLRLRRRVALKMLRVGRDASPIELARFRAEAEAVARLQHPNIVAIHEVGEHEGRPFIALELVDGGTLAERLESRTPTCREAAELVLVLARAVQVAHDHGVVHRDLKPSNVLLARDGTPKISDFGVAKSLAGDAGAFATRTGELLGTPAYMAPEQARGEAGPGADVYALGAILYRALTGRPPFCGDTSWDTVAQLVAVEPVPPSRLRPNLPQDLQTICLCCLAKDPARRYASSAALADDLARHLAGLPIAARPISAFGRAAKWVRRKPLAAALIAVSGSALVALLAGGIWHERQLARALAREEAQRQGAEANLKDARAAVDRMLTRVAESQLARLPQSALVVERLLGDAIDFYNGFAARHGDRADVHRERALALRRLGDIRLQLGRTADGERDYVAAIEALDALVAADAGDAESRLAAGGARNNWANLLLATQRLPEAEAALRRALEDGVLLARERPGDARIALLLGQLRHSLGSALSNTERLVESEALLRAAIEVVDVTVLAVGGDEATGQLARSCHNLAMLLRSMGRTADGREPLGRAVALHEARVAQDPSVPQRRAELAGTLNTLGILCQDLDDDAAAERAYEKALALQERLVADFPAFPDYRSELAATLHNSGELQLVRRAHERAAALFLRAIDEQLRALAASPRDPTFLGHLANHRWAAAEALVELGRHAEAADCAARVPELEPGRADRCRLGALLLCRCVASARKDEALSEASRAECAERYGARAVALLRVAGDLGGAGDLDAADFEPVRARADFAALRSAARSR